MCRICKRNGCGLGPGTGHARAPYWGHAQRAGRFSPRILRARNINSVNAFYWLVDAGSRRPLCCGRAFPDRLRGVPRRRRSGPQIWSSQFSCSGGRLFLSFRRAGRVAPPAGWWKRGSGGPRRALARLTGCVDDSHAPVCTPSAVRARTMGRHKESDVAATRTAGVTACAIGARR